MYLFPLHLSVLFTLLPSPHPPLSLFSSHLLKMAMERKNEMMKELSEERDQLIIQSSELKKEAMLLQRANEEARQTQSLALEERSKVRGEEV